MPCQAGKDVISHDDITQSLFITHIFYKKSALVKSKNLTIKGVAVIFFNSPGVKYGQLWDVSLPSEPSSCFLFRMKKLKRVVVVVVVVAVV